MTVFQIGHMAGCDDAEITGKRRKWAFATADFLQGYEAGFRFKMWLIKGRSE